MAELYEQKKSFPLSHLAHDAEIEFPEMNRRCHFNYPSNPATGIDVWHIGRTCYDSFMHTPGAKLGQQIYELACGTLCCLVRTSLYARRRLVVERPWRIHD